MTARGLHLRPNFEANASLSSNRTGGLNVIILQTRLTNAAWFASRVLLEKAESRRTTLVV
jgi:hypothetical protein